MIDDDTPESNRPAVTRTTGHRQALLTTWVGATQMSMVEWVPDYIQPKSQVLMGQDDRVWVVEEIY